MIFNFYFINERMLYIYLAVQNFELGQVLMVLRRIQKLSLVFIRVYST